MNADRVAGRGFGGDGAPSGGIDSIWVGGNWVCLVAQGRYAVGRSPRLGSSVLGWCRFE
jgi:hypothetical protein